jgi:hypothetical protein
MTATSGTTTSGRRGLFIAVLIVVGLVAAAIGAYLDWLWWHPTEGILVTLIAIGAILLAGLLFLFRRSIITRLAFIGLAIGVGLLLGQWLGPSREPLAIADGTMTMRLDGPVQAEATGQALCQVVASGEELYVSQDINARLALDGVPAEAYPFVSGSFARGDRWQPDQGGREDGLVVTIYMNSAVEPEDGGITELYLQSDPSSALEASEDDSSGSVRFSGLVVSSGEVEAILGVDGEVSGTLEWTCDAIITARP